MANGKLILATSHDGTDITVADCQKYLNEKNKANLADFIYDRFFGRYLKPFDYNRPDYIKSYKNGFALMASCCLLIETYVSFSTKQFRDTNNQSGKCFGHFFTTEKRFSVLAKGGLKPNGSIANKKDGGIPNEFYSNVRCGILHNAETNSGWAITRNKSKPYFNPATKEINATKFANRLKAVLSDYKKKLKSSDFDNDDIWKNFKNRLNDLITKS